MMDMSPEGRRKGNLPLRCTRRKTGNNKSDGHGVGDGKDLISAMPDDILVCLLSLLETKEAGRTSVLSKRWRYVWTLLYDPDFEFYDPETLFFMLGNPTNYWIKTNKYVNWVNQVVSAHRHRAPYINSFKVHFPLNNIYTADIDKWFHFAMNKRVRDLQLNLGNFLDGPMQDSYCLSPYYKCSPQNPLVLRFPPNNSTLESLSLVGVSMSTQLLDCILSSCLNLQRLSLSNCKGFDTLTFSFSSLKLNHLKLKHLQIFHCFVFERVEISAPNLTSFVYTGEASSVVYHHVPSLVEATFGALYCKHIMDNLHLLSLFSSQLEKLSLILYDQVRLCSSGFAEAFSNVKQLELTVVPHVNILCVTSFIVACPLLHTFKLKLLTGGSVSEVMELYVVTKHAIENLKVVEFIGFDGTASAAELALYLTEHCPVLDKFIFDPRTPQWVGEPQKWYGDTYRNELSLAMREAKQLAERIEQIKPIEIVIM